VEVFADGDFIGLLNLATHTKKPSSQSSFDLAMHARQEVTRQESYSMIDFFRQAI
jgi:hypothetical protein